MMLYLPEKINDEEQLDELLSRPVNETVEMFRRLEGDIMILGIAGKIGPSLALMAKRASHEAGLDKRIIGVSRFRNKADKEKLENSGIETISGDLLDTEFLKSLPSVKNIFFLAGMKFGAEDNLAMTWAVNTYLPALVAETFKKSRIVAYSTGCVYPFVSPDTGGSVETDDAGPLGDYSQSCLGRERMFEYGSLKNKTNITIIRLNYAVELRYGVLTDIALKVKNGLPVDLSMGYFNAIWQGDANDMVLRSLEYAGTPVEIFNITGREIISVRTVAEEFGRLFGKKVKFTGSESPTALLSNSRKATKLFGAPVVPPEKIVRWIAYWLAGEKRILDKPTHFEVRDGKY